MMIADLIDAYEGAAKLRGLAPTQMNALKPVCRAFAGYKPHELTPKAIIGYVNGRRRGHHSNAHGTRPAADGTIRRELGALSAVLNWAHQRNVIEDAPPKLDLPPASPPRSVFLGKAEADVLWFHAERSAERVGLFVCLALDTWARANAIETLTVDRLGNPPHTVDYRDPLRPETSKRRMPVPLSTRLKERLAKGWHMPLYPLVVGPVTQYAWTKFLHPLPIRQDLTRHDLRRTGISLALARGVEPMKVAQMAGDNLDTILKHYAHFMPDYLDGVVS